MLLNGLAAVVLATPVVGYLLAPIVRGEGGRYRKWIDLGELDEFPEGQTRLAKYKNPISNAWDGETDDIPCWVRRVQGETFQVFAINCAHLGCPVRWFPQSGLFMCPCHGGVYYQRWLARFRTAAARPVRISLQSGERPLDDRGRTTADAVDQRQPSCRGARDVKAETKIGDWFEQRLKIWPAVQRDDGASRFPASPPAGSTSSAAPRSPSSFCRSSPASCWR